MKQTWLLFAFCAANFAAQAQFQPTGNLTIFSEDGDRFTLVLNGEKINATPQTNLRVEDLNQPYYNAKVIFEDKALDPISKNALQIIDADGVFMDVTYKIRRSNGKMKLNYFSAIPVQPNFIPPANVAVFHFGRPGAVAPIQQSAPVGGVTQQTTTQTTTVGTPGLNVNVNPASLNMNVSITDPLETTTQTTTTRTTTTITHSDIPATTTPPQNQVGCVNATPMAPGNFNAAINTIRNTSFSESQLKTAKQIAMTNCLSTGQIMQICKLFGFDETKLEFAKFAYNSCVDPSNYFQVNEVFSFSSSSDALNTFITGQ